MIRKLKSLIGNRSPIRLGWHKAKAFVAAVHYGFPAKKLTVIGVTGTDGKTTTVSMIAHILHENGMKVGALSTAFLRVGDSIEWNKTQKTSPSPFLIQKFLRRLVNKGYTHAVLEYSSHGLVQHRLDYTYPLVGAITNLTPEHLDYHKTMEQYAKDKGLLFQMLKEGGTKVLNGNSETSYEWFTKIPTTHTVGYTTNGDFGEETHDDNEVCYWAESIVSAPDGSTATILSTKSRNLPMLKLHIPGAFNVENALCAITCCETLGIDGARSINALASFTGTPGRMEPIREGQPFTVIVDFTVTPASYEATLSSLKKALPAGKKLMVLTGSCGDRMKEKRPQVGKICSTYADVVVVANEDPYTEDPQKIIDEVFAGIDQSKTEAHKIFDRKEAIGFLLKKAEPGDIVILCGKGSDTTMMMGTTQVPWNEREIVREMLQGVA